jgi:putative ABC transport system substrate-binding protein
VTGRRRLLIALGAGLAWPPLKVFAQQAGGMPVVGVLGLGIERRVETLRDGLRKLGYAEGKSIRLEERATGDRYARLTEIAEEYVRLKVDVIVAMGNTAVVAARKATATIPIVMVAATDPVKEKLAVSLSHPGGNVTGVTTIGQETSPKRLELVKEAIPGITRVGVLWNPDSRGSTNSLAQTQEAAKSLKLQLQLVEARSAADFDKAFEALAGSRIHVFVQMPASMFSANRGPLLESAAKHRMAGVFSTQDWDDEGTFIKYGPDYIESFRYASTYVDKILKGAKPGDLPIEQTTKYELVVNLKTAKALGIKVSRTILVRADRVIE